MAGKLILLCSLQRVAVLDDTSVTPRLKGFALNLSVGWSGGDPPTGANSNLSFSPWLWPRLKQIQGIWKKSDGSTVPAGVVALIDQSNVPAQPPAVFATELGRKFEEARLNPENLVLKPQPAAGTPDRAALTYKFDSSRALRPWHATLNHISTYPFPLPQSCNLTHLFRVPEEAGTVELIAAPVFIKATGGVFPEETYAPAGEPIAIGNDAVEWAYTPATPVEIVARLQPAPVTVTSDNFIKLDQLWVKPPISGATQFTTDWQATVEPRMAEAFQLAQFLLEFMRDPSSAAALDQGANLDKCVTLTLGTLRDVIGIGATAGPDGVRIAKRLFEHFPFVELSRLDQLDQQTATTGWNQLDNRIIATMTDWRRFLRDFLSANVPEATPLAILQDAPRPQDPLKILSIPQAVAELEWLMGTLLDTRPQKDRPTAPGQQPALWRLFIAQWERLPDAAIPDATLRTQLKKALTEMKVPDRIEVLDLRQQLRLSNLGKFWPSFITSQKTAADDPLGHKLLEECLPAFLKYYAVKRLGLDFDLSALPCNLPSTPSTEPQFFPPFPADAFPDGALKTALKTKFESWITNFLDAFRPATPPNLANSAISNTPHAITMQAARVQGDPGKSDPLEQISGIGVLMREAGTPTWRPLNLASAKLDTTTLFPGQAVLVPYRLHYRGDLRQVCISYNNQPLAAESPLADPKMTSAEMSLPLPGVLAPAGVGTDVNGLIRYDYFPTAVMPGLKFGGNYQFALFAILNSGVLPKELTTADAPCSLKGTFDALPADSIVGPIPYQRFVRIGALRTLNCELTGTTPDTYDCKQPEASVQRYAPLKLPPIPENVSPRARDIPNLNTSKADTREDAALILLAPKSWRPQGPNLELFSFGVRLPATGWECWDRWVAGTPASVSKQERQDVLADFARETARNKRRNSGDEVDVLLDDPAVEKQLLFMLFKETNGDLGLVSPSAGKAKFAFVPVTRAGSAKMEKFQSLPIPVVCKFTTGEEGLEVKPALAVGKSSRLIVSVKQGEAYRLTVCACITGTNVSKFGSNVVNVFPIPADVNTNGLTLVSPSHFVIEAATDKMPTAVEVYNATATTFFDDRGQWKLSARVEGRGAANFRNLHRAEVDRQVWRWQGRNTQPHPDLEADFSTDQVKSTSVTEYRKKILDWEAVEFGERTDADHVTHDMKSEITGIAGERVYKFEELLGLERDGREKSLELRGLHFRLATRVFSRYESLMPVGSTTSVMGVQQLGIRADGTEVFTPWHSQFVPCRRQPPFESPKIKFALPLTEGVGGDKTGSPGILIVLNERWHENGGLGEELEAEIALSPDPSKPPDQVDTFYRELGPDPIVTREGLLPGIKSGVAPTVQVNIAKPIGPVGHFYDRDQGSALFVNSSFLLPAPEIVPAVPNKLGWYFAKVRLRRVISTRTPINAVAHNEYLPTPDWKRGKLVSEFTESFWVQFLPEFSIFEGAENPVDSLRLEVNIPGPNGSVPHTFASLGFLNDKSEVVILREFKSEKNIFSLYVVLTARVFDVTGRTDQEAYVGLFKPGGGGVWTTDDVEVERWAPNEVRKPQFIARVIELQEPTIKPAGIDNICLNTSGATKDLWDRLFGKTDNSQRDCDTNARIVRISKPIETVPPRPCED